MSKTHLGDHLISCAAVLVVSDIHRAAAFYKEKLGFNIAEIWGDPPSFAIADTPRASIMLKQGPTDQSKSLLAPNSKRVGGLWDVYIWVTDLAPLLERFADTVVSHAQPEVAPHGCTEIVVTDPDGYLICFGYCP